MFNNEDHFVHLIHINTRRSKIDLFVLGIGGKVCFGITCIRVSLLHTDACNIISHSIFTGISLRPPHYSIQRGTWGVVFHSDPRHWDGVLQCYTPNNNVNIYIYDVPLRQTWFCSGPSGRIETQLRSTDSISHSNQTTPGVCATNYDPPPFPPTDLNWSIDINGTEAINWSGWSLLIFSEYCILLLS